MHTHPHAHTQGRRAPDNRRMEPRQYGDRSLTIVGWKRVLLWALQESETQAHFSDVGNAHPVHDVCPIYREPLVRTNKQFL